MKFFCYIAYLLTLVGFSPALQAQTPPAPRICITKRCTGMYANKSDVLALKKIAVLSDTLTVEKFVVGASINGYECSEAHNAGNLFNEYTIKIFNRITKLTKVFFNITFISNNGFRYTYDYFFMIKTK
jgi:hypothetical protein